MATEQPPDDALVDDEELAAEHRALKRETSALAREHQHLHETGGTREEHEDHRRKLHQKIVELGRHARRLKKSREQPR
jgi:hypothetical protein